jgi:hypothetical protein
MLFPVMGNQAYVEVSKFLFSSLPSGIQTNSEAREEC